MTTPRRSSTPTPATPRPALTTGCNDWESGLDVVVEGRAVQVTDDALLERLAEAWTRKSDGQWRYRVYGGAFHHEDGGEAFVFSWLRAPRSSVDRAAVS
jgi:hypothetical protein